MKTIAVVTALTNNRTKLQEPLVKEEGVTYTCFTDDPELRSEGWNVVVIEGLNHKKPKMFPYLFVGEHDYYVWVDACVQLKSKPSDVVRSVEGDWDVAVFKAEDHDCAYKEAEACLSLKLSPVEDVDKATRYLKREGYPKNNGMVSGGVILYKKELNKGFNDLWYWFISQMCSRDQVSFNYCVWKTSVKLGFIPGFIRNNKFLKCKWRMVDNGKRR